MRLCPLAKCLWIKTIIAFSSCRVLSLIRYLLYFIIIVESPVTHIHSSVVTYIKYISYLNFLFNGILHFRWIHKYIRGWCFYFLNFQLPADCVMMWIIVQQVDTDLRFFLTHPVRRIKTRTGTIRPHLNNGISRIWLGKRSIGVMWRLLNKWTVKIWHSWHKLRVGHLQEVLQRVFKKEDLETIINQMSHTKERRLLKWHL